MSINFKLLRSLVSTDQFPFDIIGCTTSISRKKIRSVRVRVQSDIGGNGSQRDEDQFARMTPDFSREIIECRKPIDFLILILTYIQLSTYVDNKDLKTCIIDLSHQEKILKKRKKKTHSLICCKIGTCAVGWGSLLLPPDGATGLVLTSARPRFMPLLAPERIVYILGQ